MPSGHNQCQQLRWQQSELGLGDSGITADIRHPLANALMQQCRENAKVFVKRNKLEMNSELVLSCASIRDANIDVADNDLKLTFPDFQLCQSVKAIAKVEAGRNPRACRWTRERNDT